MAAWAFFYRRGMTVSTDRAKAGVRAMKTELIYNGFAGAIQVSLPGWGDAVTNQTERFQERHGLVADGVIGPNTARVLLRSRKDGVEALYAIPDHLLGRLATLESDNDPIAQGVVDPRDEGLMQINLPSHPDVTVAAAWDPAYALHFSGSLLADAHEQLQDWDAALVAYNLGEALASRWLAAGKPASGGPTLSDGREAWVIATEYVKLVRGAAI